MYEFSIARSLCGQIERIAGENRFTKVTSIRLKIGRLRGVCTGSLRDCLELLLESTVGDGAVIEIDEIPLEIRCESCGKRYILERDTISCPVCPDGMVSVIAGKELVFDAVIGEPERVEPLF